MGILRLLQRGQSFLGTVKLSKRRRLPLPRWPERRWGAVDGLRFGSPRPNAGEGLGVRGIDALERSTAALSTVFVSSALLVSAS